MNMRKANEGDYIRLHKPFIYYEGKMISLGRIETILKKRVDKYNGRYLIKCDDIGKYLDRKDFDVLTEDEYLVELI